jgi:GT2 family glycosyltransferase
MKTPWIVCHIDLSEGPREIAGSPRPHFLVFWWRGLPLGQQALLAGELPLRRAQVADLLAGFAAEQAIGRRPALGAPVRAAYDAHPLSHPPLAAAAKASALLADLDAWAALPVRSAAGLSVIICTRDRPAQLAACLASLAAQASPPGEVVVVDNSREGSARAVAEGPANLIYVHEPRPGLSIARNVGIAAAHGEIVAFTDDDVEPHDHWTSEIVRAFEDGQVEAVTGLVLPARLDTTAQVAFQMDLGGFTSRFSPLLFAPEFLELTRNMGPQVWRIGAGANMAFRRSVFTRFGGFDERLGAGASGCSEDSEYWYRILAAGGRCLYEPRATVFHHHREDMAGLRRQVRAYMSGHIAALIAQADRYGHRGNIRRIVRQLPRYFVLTALSSVKNLAWGRLLLLGQEVAGWLAGLVYFLPTGWRKSHAISPAPVMSQPATKPGAIHHA